LSETKEEAMLEFSSPESLRAEMEYRRVRATQLAHPARSTAPGWLARLFHRHPEDGDRYDAKAVRCAA
jgi:hypothetical protein